VAGTDVGYDPATGRYRAAVVVLSYPRLEVLEIARVRGRTTFPYIPGLLSYREIPPLLRAFHRLRLRPDLVLCDGQGLAHPRRFGLACHLGVLLGIPAIGCAKSRLVGEYSPVPPHRGGHSPLVLDGEPVGAVLRTREKVQPIFVSPGHRMSVTLATVWALRCTGRFRIPEPTRRADQEVRRMRSRPEPRRDAGPRRFRSLC
jgi:deoxyribonuclease V